jgi:hypothetical protein
MKNFKVRLGRLLVVVPLALCLMLLPACGGGAPGKKGAERAPEDIPPREKEAVEAAKHKDKGDGLKPGESREIMTPGAIVIISKDQNGNVTYKVKN